MITYATGTNTEAMMRTMGKKGGRVRAGEMTVCVLLFDLEALG
jgi:hypothetical protein